ncbi:MBL fold metallo-hydrolase [bacterium]|nr:MBL fold metallo-hydrolase [candidate division CSSED10-310 bacterium]
MMRITFHGVRGSVPTCAATHQAWGGHTTCILVEVDGHGPIVFDAGTGAHVLGEQLAGTSASPIHMLFTHYHLDHVAGFPAFKPLYEKDRDIRLLGPGRPSLDPLFRLLDHPYWPVRRREVPCRLTAGVLLPSAAGGMQLMPGLSLRWTVVAHPQGCVAYRLDHASGASFALATDIEWPVERRRHGGDSPLVRLLAEPRPVNLLVFDAHFTDQEYPHHQGWGHSTPSHAGELLARCGVTACYLTHHAVEHDDTMLNALADECSERGLRLARQGETVEVQDV